MTQPSLYESDVMPLQEAAHSDWLAEARSRALEIGRDGRSVTVDNVREELPPPEGVDPRVMGAIFRTSDWEAVGFVNSRRRLCHNRPIREFKRRDVSRQDWE